MNVKTINSLLAGGEIDRDDMWPRIAEFESKAVTFRFDFGLDELPTEPGVIVIRGPRQYGKSTWLDLELRDSIREFGKGSAYYLNGDELVSSENFIDELISVERQFHPRARVKRIFIDEITSVPDWERSIKRLWDGGHLRETLLVTTGSKARDLRRGHEKLPGRKGRLAKTEYVFLPVSYKDFHENCSGVLGEDTWIAYLLSGGSPIACNDIFQFERLPEYFIQLTRDWIFGDIVSTGRSRLSLLALLRALFRYGGSPVGYAKLAREAGLANNTVASGYIEQLSDLLCVLPSWPWEPSSGNLQFRKPCKFHFINLAAAIAFHEKEPRLISDFKGLTSQEQGLLMEWLVAQEIWRRSVLAGGREPDSLGFWASKTNEVDFVTPARELIEVKTGKAGPADFGWFPSVFPKSRLRVICSTPFETSRVKGITIEEFLFSG